MTSTAAPQTERWERLRRAGTAINDAISDIIQEVGADEPVDRLAIMAGMVPALTHRMTDTTSEAIDTGARWADIANALGEGSDRKSALRVRARHQNELHRRDAGGEGS